MRIGLVEVKYTLCAFYGVYWFVSISQWCEFSISSVLPLDFMFPNKTAHKSYTLPLKRELLDCDKPRYTIKGLRAIRSNITNLQ